VAISIKGKKWIKELHNLSPSETQTFVALMLFSEGRPSQATREQIAELTGLCTQTVGTCVHGLKEKGLVTVKKFTVGKNGGFDFTVSKQWTEE